MISERRGLLYGIFKSSKKSSIINKQLIVYSTVGSVTLKKLKMLCSNWKVLSVIPRDEKYKFWPPRSISTMFWLLSREILVLCIFDYMVRFTTGDVYIQLCSIVCVSQIELCNILVTSFTMRTHINVAPLSGRIVQRGKKINQFGLWEMFWGYFCDSKLPRMKFNNQPFLRAGGTQAKKSAKFGRMGCVLQLWHLQNGLQERFFYQDMILVW